MTTYTAADVKKFLNRKGDQSGFAFDKNGPHFVNAERYKAMKDHFEYMVALDEERPAPRMSARTIASINGWFADIRNKYCL